MAGAAATCTVTTQSQHRVGAYTVTCCLHSLLCVRGIAYKHG